MYRGLVGVRQTEIHIVEPFLLEPIATSEVEVAIGKFKRYKLPDVNHIPAELIQAGVETLHSEIHKFAYLM
jgi:hypothetical protein